jgi:hypothetical protein
MSDLKDLLLSHWDLFDESVKNILTGQGIKPSLEPRLGLEVFWRRHFGFTEAAIARGHAYFRCLHTRNYAFEFIASQLELHFLNTRQELSAAY